MAVMITKLWTIIPDGRLKSKYTVLGPVPGL